MLLSHGAGSAGLITRSHFAKPFVGEIEAIAYRELRGLDKVCASETRRERRRKRAHLHSLQQLLGFYLCVSERFFVACGVRPGSEHLAALRDGVRELVLQDPWRRRHDKHQQPIWDYLRVSSCQRHLGNVQGLYMESDTSDELSQNASIAIARHLVRRREDAVYLQELSRIVRARLDKTAIELINGRSYCKFGRRVRAVASTQPNTR